MSGQVATHAGIASSSEVPRVAAAELATFIKRAFEAAGLASEDANIVAALMVEADLRGSDTHGVIRLPLYLRRLKAGGIAPRPDIRIVQERPGSALVDGGNGIGHLVMRFAAMTAIEKAKRAGVAWVGARMSNHAGPAALYAMMPLAHDMIGLYFAVGSNNHLPPWGSSENLLGTNPIAIAIPSEEEAPIVLDMAPTVAAFGKVRLKMQRGEEMPVGWMISRDGKPLTDPKRAEEGLLLPIGDYKGYGLSLIVGLLAGTLNQAAFGREVVDFVKEPGRATNTGHAIVALSVEAFAPAAVFKRQVDAAVRAMRAAQRLPGVERIWLPGEQSHLKRQDRAKNGIPMSKSLRDNLDAAARELGIAPLG
jgi:L-2-hydroxycarboxylate dehydrogenase (NAD+)